MRLIHGVSYMDSTPFRDAVSILLEFSCDLCGTMHDSVFIARFCYARIMAAASSYFVCVSTAVSLHDIAEFV